MRDPVAAQGLDDGLPAYDLFRADFDGRAVVFSTETPARGHHFDAKAVEIERVALIVHNVNLVQAAARTVASAR